MLFHMDSIDELTTSMTSSTKNTGFIKHVFNFDDKTKNEISNIVQYAILAIIPIVLLNKITQSYVPESDEKKATLEITIEIMIQVVFLFVGMYFIHRIITYMPTFSNVEYGDINLLNIVLCFMVIVLSLQTKLGLKVEILSDRMLNYLGLNNEPTSNNNNNNNTKVSVTQPIVHNGGGIPPTSHQPSQADNLGNHQTMPNATSAIDQLPNQSNMGSHQQQPQQQQVQMQQSQPNFDSMYQEPMAANDALGFAPF